MEQILSQDEVDALLKGITGGEIEEPEELTPAEAGEYTPYDFSQQERIAQTRMPTMDAICDIFSRRVRASLSGTLRRIVDITVATTELERFGAFTRTLPVPSSLQVFRMNPFRGHALMIIEPRLVFDFVESFLGGSGNRNIRIEGRDFTGIEQRLIQRIVNQILTDLEKAWQLLQPVTVDYTRSEINPQFAKICEPEDVVIINRFDLEMDRTTGSITICTPLNNIESIKHKLTSFQQDQGEEDTNLRRQLTTDLKKLSLEIKVNLGNTHLSAGKIISLKKGDIIQLDQRKNELLPVYIAGKNKFMGSPGINRGNKAILLKRKINDQEQESTGE